MTTVSVHEAKTHLSRLINQVLAGTEVTVTRGKEPVVKLVPVRSIEPRRRTPGRFAHLLPAGTDPLDGGFWDPLPIEHLGLGSDADPLA